MYVCAEEEEELAREPRASLSFLERDITIKLAPSRNVDATAKRNEHAYNAPQVSPTKWAKRVASKHTGQHHHH